MSSGSSTPLVDQLAEPVVGADDDVGPVAGRGGEAELLADLAELELLHGDGDAVLLGERRGDLLDDRLARVVGPDHEVGVAAGWRRRGGRALRLGAAGGRALGGACPRPSCPRRWCLRAPRRALGGGALGTAGVIVVVVTAGGGDEREAGEHRQSGRPERASAHDPPSMGCSPPPLRS